MLNARTTLTTALLSALVATGVLSAAAPATAAGTPPASVTVVHALADVVADVAVDGTTVLTGFRPNRSTDPLPIPAGRHRVEVRRAGDLATPALVDTSLELVAGESYSLVAHRDLEDEPVVTSFANDTSVIPAGSGRLVLHNTAALAAAQVVVDGQPLGGAAAHGTSTGSVLPAGPHTVAVRAPASGQFLLANRTVQVPAGASTLLYLVGSQDDGLDWLVDTLDVDNAVPFGVPTGDSGLKARQAAAPVSPAALGLVALVGIVATRRAVRSRCRAR